MLRDEAVVLDILNAAELLKELIEGFTFDSFAADIRTRLSVQHQLIVMGEATKRLSPEFRAAHPEIPWRGIAGLRDVVVHNYDTIDLEIIWETATQKVPELIAILPALIPPRA
jgi:uncharacterized protein with HEPN domain